MFRLTLNSGYTASQERITVVSRGLRVFVKTKKQKWRFLRRSCYFFEYGSTAFKLRDSFVEATWRMDHARLNK